ncbi:MAG: DNA polymerase III subunit delta [Lachnospiraceae bacterium]|nr:DNA polymerase III subunit delta [Lachnospiraceae bacterium]
MEVIREQIKQHNLSHAFLLYGKEQQGVKIYRNKILTELLGTDSLEQLKQDMNFSLFIGSPIDVDAIIQMASSYPFMGEKRVILVENGRLFSRENAALSECIKNLPETTYIVFTEGELSVKDKKDLFNAIKEVGHIAEINEQKQEYVESWVIKKLANSGKRISKAALEALINRVGCDMMRLDNETDKIIAYKGEEQDIRAEDVAALVSENPQDRIFVMTDAIADRKPSLAMNCYLDLLELKESPQRILSLIERHMKILYQVKDLRTKGFGAREITDEVKEIPKEFVARKYMNQASKFSVKEITDCLEDCVDLNLKSRTGALTDRMAVELIIVKYSQQQSGK